MAQQDTAVAGVSKIQTLRRKIAVPNEISNPRVLCAAFTAKVLANR